MAIAGCVVGLATSDTYISHTNDERPISDMLVAGPDLVWVHVDEALLFGEVGNSCRQR
jgi:hypothetical protein